MLARLSPPRHTGPRRGFLARASDPACLAVRREMRLRRMEDHILLLGSQLTQCVPPAPISLANAGRAMQRHTPPPHTHPSVLVGLWPSFKKSVLLACSRIAASMACRLRWAAAAPDSPEGCAPHARTHLRPAPQMLGLRLALAHSQAHSQEQSALHLSPA